MFCPMYQQSEASALSNFTFIPAPAAHNEFHGSGGEAGERRFFL
jgi:hypothetical protein